MGSNFHVHSVVAVFSLLGAPCKCSAADDLPTLSFKYNSNTIKIDPFVPIPDLHTLALLGAIVRLNFRFSSVSSMTGKRPWSRSFARYCCPYS